MPKVYIPHRIPPEGRLLRIVNAGFASKEQVDALILKNHQAGRVDMEQVVKDALGDHDPPWTEAISGKLQLAVEGEDGEPTGEIVELVITDGICEVPAEHLAHTLAGVSGSFVMEG